jgi:hypothetical protein
VAKQLLFEEEARRSLKRGVGLTMTLLPRGLSWVAVPLTVLVICA